MAPRHAECTGRSRCGSSFQPGTHGPSSTKRAFASTSMAGQPSGRVCMAARSSDGGEETSVTNISSKGLTSSLTQTLPRFLWG